MNIAINASSCEGANHNEESLERLLRIAFTRYAFLLRQVTLDVERTAAPGRSPGYWVRLTVCSEQWPDVEIEEMQPRMELAIDRAIHRIDGILRHYVRKEVKRAG